VSSHLQNPYWAIQSFLNAWILSASLVTIIKDDAVKIDNCCKSTQTRMHKHVITLIHWTNPILFTNKWNAHAHVHFLTEVLIIGYDVRWLDMHTSQYWKASKMDSTTQNTKRWWVISLTEVIMNLSTVEQNKTTPRWLKCCCMTLSAPLSSRYCRFFRYSKKGPMT
jgi:hypothetical protein